MFNKSILFKLECVFILFFQDPDFFFDFLPEIIDLRSPEVERKCILRIDLCVVSVGQKKTEYGSKFDEFPLNFLNVYHGFFCGGTMI